MSPAAAGCMSTGRSSATHCLRDVTEFLRRAGMDDITEDDVLRGDRLAWRRAEPVACPAVSEPRTHETAPRLSHSRGWRQGAECSGRVRTQLDSAPPDRVRGRSRRPASAGVRVRFRGPDDSSTQSAHIPLTKPHVCHPAVRRGPPLSAVQAAGYERTMVVSKVLRARLRLDSSSTGRMTGPPALVPHGSGSTRGRRTNRPGRNWPERRLTVGISRGGSPHRAVGLVMPCRGQR